MYGMGDYIDELKEKIAQLEEDIRVAKLANENLQQTISILQQMTEYSNEAAWKYSELCE